MNRILQAALNFQDAQVFMRMHDRNDTLEEVAKEFDKMTSLGDTAASFAVFVRSMKR